MLSEIKSMATKSVKRIDINPENGKYVGVVNVEKNEDFLVTVKIKRLCLILSIFHQMIDFLISQQI